ncbi:glycosyltransferase [Bradyrhizobium sp. SRS-191]|uniref:CgeB family protein n=1 Tax=Bradyrhizobium sp. SRS-191 TaxID=2962606 RepID=UPI00211E1DAD|nr:glycosyltransferase [Bradyrhizobium sp. SRS-191]
MNLNIVVIGLSVTSSWGNGHATTYRALLAALTRRGHSVTFLERDVPWYRDHRDLTDPRDWRIHLYKELPELPRRFGALIRDADLVIIGSYVPDGIAIADWVTSHAQGVTAFYDIDTPVTLAGLEDGHGLSYLSASMIPRFDLYLSFSGGPALAMVEDLYGSPMARVLYCSADTELYQPRDVPNRWSLGYLGTYSADRQPQLENLLLAPARATPDARFAIAGAQYPDDIVWPANVDRITHLPPHQHADFFAAQHFTLNVTRADMRNLGFSPSVRLFEAAACAAPVLSDAWPGLETIFTPNKEILVVSSPREVATILREMPEDTRRAVGDRARRRVLRDHTPDHRARQLEDYHREALARRARLARRSAVSATSDAIELKLGLS